MLSWIKRLLGRGQPAEDSPERLAAMEAFDAQKQAALESSLGPMDSHVVHAIIPWVIGGSLDLYPFSGHLPGTVYVTQELLTFDAGDRVKPSKQGWFELAIAFRKEAVPDPNTLPESAQTASRLLNPIARYAGMASLSPGETVELPADEGEPGVYIFLDRLECKPLAVGGEPFFLLLVIQINQSEYAFARASGSAQLRQRLKEHGHYPFSDLNRPSVC